MFRSFAVRGAVGIVLGVVVWAGLRGGLPSLPEGAQFLIGWLVFTAGPGFGLAGWVSRDLDPLSRAIVVLGAGSAAAAVLIEWLGYAGHVEALPWICSATLGAGLATWRRAKMAESDGAVPVRTTRVDVVACVTLVALTATLGYVAFAHRLVVAPGGVTLNGEYDSADLGYYAAEASEATHTVPPQASYYSGHQLNAAFYPQLVLGMIHRFTGAPTLSVYYRYAWPTFLTLAALTAFIAFRAVSTTVAAWLAVALIVLGSDFSYLAAWFLPHAALDWDYLLWPTNFFSPTMQVLFFSTWCPSLPVFFTVLATGLFGLRTRAWSWTVLSAILLAVLFEFKPFAYVVLMAALSACVVFAGRDWGARVRYGATMAIGALCTMPFLLAIRQLGAEDRRSKLVLEFFRLPKQMLTKIDLWAVFTREAHRLVPWPALQMPAILAAATVMFLVGGLGVRWIGIPGVWRAVWGIERDQTGGWRWLAWIVVAGVAIPFVVVTDPYVDTLQFYLTGLYILWLFVAVALAALTARNAAAGGVAIALVFALALPSSLHYLSRKWTDDQRAPKASLSREELTIADYLRANTDPETTVVLHDRPLSPSLMTIVSERRIVLGWDVKYSAVGGEARLADVDALFSSADRGPAGAADAWATLQRYKVTHLLVRNTSDRVSPMLLARLRPVLTFDAVSLYAVPR